MELTRKSLLGASMVIVAVFAACAQNIFPRSENNEATPPLLRRDAAIRSDPPFLAPHIAKGRMKPVSDESEPNIWNQLAHTHWIADGPATAHHVIYVFTDPNCPYCNAFWGEARPWVRAGKVQLRHVLVGILTPSSPGKAAALLTSRNPASEFSTYEGLHIAKTENAFATGKLHEPLDDAGLKPLKNIPPATRIMLERNEEMMSKLGQEAVPVILWLDSNDKVHMHTGLPPKEDLVRILGPLSD